MLWCNDDSDKESSDTDLDDDSAKLPTINFTGIQSHAISDGPMDFKYSASKKATSINVEDPNFKSCDLLLPSEAGCAPLDVNPSVACLSNEVVMVASSESDGEDDLVIPLSERLKMRFTESKKFEKTDHSISKSGQENSNFPSKLQHGNVDPKIKLTDVTEIKDQTTGSSFIRQRTNICHSTWDISLSDDDTEPVKLHEPQSNSSQPCIGDLTSSKEVTSTLPKHRKKIKPISSEMGKLQQEKLKKCEERELQRAEKENIRRQREEEKAAKKMLADIEKMLRPGECLKSMQVLIDPGLLQIEGGGQLLSTLQAMEVSCVIEDQTIPHSVTWRRRHPCIAGQQMDAVTEWTDELHVVVHIPLEEFVSMVHAQKRELEGTVTKDQMTLQSFTLDILQKSAGRVPSLAIVELEKHFSLQKKQRSQKKPQQTAAKNGQDKRRRKGCEHNVSLISRADVEIALVHLQLSVGVQVELFETWKEFADYVSMFTKAVAEAPFKRARDNKGLSVYLESDGSKRAKIDPSGKGLLNIWKKQIQQLNRVSSEMANAIISVYPSPKLLTQAYQICSSEHEKEKLLADIPVRRGEGVTSTTRRIGPELSKRVHLLMTTLEPEHFLE